MGFNSAFKGLKKVKNPGKGRLNNLNDPVLCVREGEKIILLTRDPCLICAFQSSSSWPPLIDNVDGWDDL
jgi:hypothetical protein